ncbi:glycosyltransferase family 4 protein [Rheinheimera sp. SA_1]|uniref:glycosyltransferase family 4 protein n=1 Tax=Rheinheimera sp. SA_1 TaxID=1827365 RepID=UPI0009ED703C|nr:glycosyltransferase family 4 protein [Rheinheimera sp. SA_1]
MAVVMAEVVGAPIVSGIMATAAPAKGSLMNLNPTPTRRLLIIQQVLKQYRLAFYQQLAEQLAADGIELTLCFSLPQAADVAKADNVTAPPGSYAQLVPLRQFGPLVWQQVPQVTEFDLVIVEQANRHLLNYLLLLRRLLRPSPKLIFWGHGFNHQAPAGIWSSLKERYKKTLLRHADGFFAYTAPVARYAQTQGVAAHRITVLNNSIDTAAFAAQVRTLRLQMRQQLPFDDSPGFTLLFCGALYPDKKIPLLLQTARVLADHKLLKRLIVLGDGPDRNLLLNGPTPPWLDYRGPCFGDDKAAAYAQADLVLHPGLLGLAVLDAFAAGLPLVTTNFSGHSPELAYLEHGSNGLIIEEKGLAARVLQLLQTPAELAHLAQGAAQSAATYSLPAMVQAFAAGVRQALREGDDTAAISTVPAPDLAMSAASVSSRPLRVLQIHNFYQQPGGEDVVVQNEALLLQQAGVALQTWYVDSASIPTHSHWWSKLQFAIDLCWNRQAQQQLRARLQAQPVDIIHLHNTFPLLSPALIQTAHALGVPLVLTVHNFRWCHPSGCIQSLADVGTCPWRYLGQPVYRNSRFATALLLVNIQLHQWFGTYKLCARLLCPSQFVVNALLQAGFNKQLLQLKPHSVAPDIADNHIANDQVSGVGNKAATAGYALFVGRADAAKGLYFLLDAWQQLAYPLWIVGVSEQQAAQWSGYKPNPWVRFLGAQPQSALGGLYQRATLLLVPSLVAETFGNVVIEAFSHGTPCLVSDIGGLPELLWPRHNAEKLGHEPEPGSAGQVFAAGNAADFCMKVQALLNNPGLLLQMSQQAQQLYKTYYLPQHNQQALLACYQQVLAEQGKVVGG